MDAEIRPEHVDLAAQAEVAGELPLLGLEPHVDAERGRDRSGGDAEVDREHDTRLEPEFEHLEALGGEADAEPAAAADAHDREVERALAACRSRSRS